MRVLHAISGITPANGGPAVALAGLARAQVRAGIDITVVATWRGDPAAQAQRDFEAAGVRVIQVGPAKNPMSRHPDTAAVLEREIAQADVVHVHAVWEQIQHLACRIAHAREVPYVLTPHGMLGAWDLARGWLKKRLYLAFRMKGHLNRAAALHVATEFEQQGLQNLGLKPPVVVEPFGLWRSEFESLPRAGSFRTRYPQIGGRKIIMFLGRLCDGKGLDLLIPAFAKIAADDAFLAIVGPDSHAGYRATVEKLISQHGISEQCVLTGMLTGDDKLAALADAHALCLPSFHESFGMVVIESLACGTPVIVSDQVSLHPDVTGGGAGLVCNTSIESVSDALATILRNLELREQMARRARDFSWKYDWGTIGEHWAQHYARVRGGAPIPAPGSP